ncbi:MAG TPA: hypothetical protein VFN68_12320 [Acidimicrobiales bacterium]|nr:hypothetical protein [Acidimicrobiales bacterium]
MKTLLVTDEATADRTAAIPAVTALCASNVSNVRAGARLAAPAAYRPSASAAFLGKHAQKRTWMAGIDTTGWPLGPQDRASG